MRGSFLTEEECLEAISLVQIHKSVLEASKFSNLSLSGFKKRYYKAIKRGYGGYNPIMPGFEVSKVKTTTNASGKISTSIEQKPETDDSWELPKGFVMNKLTAQISGDGRLERQWPRYDQTKIDPIYMAERIKAIFDDMKFEATAVPEPLVTNKDCLSLFCLPDLHMGLYVWKDEAVENWNLNKAIETYTQVFCDLVHLTPANDIAILLFGGDQFHSDNQNNQTSKSQNRLDVDGRYDRVLFKTCDMAKNFVSMLLEKNGKVIVRVLKGNHDEHSSTALAAFLWATFRNDRRVEMDVSPSLFWIYQFGNVMLASTHGHEAKPHQMPQIMAARWPKIWGDTQFRYAHTFHVHHKSKIAGENGGVIVETHQSPAPQDAWHYGAGFLSGRSLKSIVYNKEYGESGGFTRPIMKNMIKD